MTTQFYLARHGETQWNVIQRLQGLLDSPLTAKGQQESEALATSLADKNIQVLASSHLGRAIDTAKRCLPVLQKHNAALQLIQIEALAERDLGDWQGALLTDIETDPDYAEIFQSLTQLCPANGESAVNCAERMQQALRQLAETYQEQAILVIVHGEALRCFMSLLEPTEPVNAFELYANTCVLPVEYCFETKKLQRTKLNVGNV